MADRVRILLSLAALGMLGAPAAVLAQTSAPGDSDSTGAAFFKDAIVKDAKTTSSVKKLLSTGAGFVDPATQYGDLTGDGKPDAAVRVDTGSVQGAVAVYVFTAQDSSAGRLRIVYRNQQLNRVTAKIAGALLTLSTPIWARGDEPCCPRRVRRLDYAWDTEARTMVRQGAARTTAP